MLKVYISKDEEEIIEDLIENLSCRKKELLQIVLSSVSENE